MKTPSCRESLRVLSFRRVCAFSLSQVCAERTAGNSADMAQARVTMVFYPAGSTGPFVYDVLFPGTLPLSSSGHLPDRGTDEGKCAEGYDDGRAGEVQLLGCGVSHTVQEHTRAERPEEHRGNRLPCGCFMIAFD